MSTQIIKQTSESTAPKATKAQIIEALALQEQKERLEYNKKIEEKKEEIDKQIHEIAISHLVNKSKEELPPCEFWTHYKNCSSIKVEIVDSEINALMRKRGQIGWTKSVCMNEIKKEIKLMVSEQINIKENPLLKEENNDKVKMLLSFLKNPKQQTIELK